MAVKSSFCAIGLLFLIGCGGTGNPNHNPPPLPITLSTLVPNYVIAGTGNITLFVNGKGFTGSSVVEWNGSPLTTTFGTSSILSASLSSAQVSTPGAAQISVADNSTGAKSTNSLTFGIASPAAAAAGVVGMLTVAPDGTPGDGDSLVTPSISATARYVAFQSAATNLVAGPVSGYKEIYERDTCIGGPSGCTPNTIRISVTYDSSAVNFHSLDSAISADGRYVAFDSEATNILPNTGNCGSGCVFLRDTCLGAPAPCTPSTSLVSIASDGSPAGGGNPSISPDGRFVAFNSNSPNVVSGDPGGMGEAFVRDMCTGVSSGCTPGNTLISVPSTGVQDNGNTGLTSTSAGGRYFAFQSWGTNMLGGSTVVPGDYWRDTCIGASQGCTPSTLRADLTMSGSQPNQGISSPIIPALSADGRFVAFASMATNLVQMNVNGIGNLYVRDSCTGAPSGCNSTTSLISLANDGSIGNCGSPSQGLSMSSSGRFVAFDSIATNLSPDDTFPACSFEDVFVRDTCFGVISGCTPSTVRVSLTSNPNPQTPANAISGQPAISSDGHYVVFISAATNLVLGIPGNGHSMVYLAKTGF